VVCQGTHGVPRDLLAALILAIDSTEVGSLSAKLWDCAQSACVVEARQAVKQPGTHQLSAECAQRAVTARHWKLQEKLQASAVEILPGYGQVSGEHQSVESQEGWHRAATWCLGCAFRDQAR